MPIEKEGILTAARYRWSFYEVKRLTDAHGRQCIRKIINVFVKADRKNAQALYNAIRDVTGENLQKRFLQYQSFENKKAGMKKYTLEFNRLYKMPSKENKEQAVYNLLRVLEMYDGPFDVSSVNTRKTILLFLFQAGHKGLADKAMRRWLKEAEGACKRDSKFQLPAEYSKFIFMQYVPKKSA